MKKRTTTSVSIDIDMVDEIETRMKADGISFCELVRRALSLYLRADSIDSEQPKSISDMLANSDFAVK